MSELKKNQAPSLYNETYNAASLKILKRNKNDFIDRKTVWHIAIFSFLLGTLLSILTFWLISKPAPLTENTNSQNHQFQNNQSHSTNAISDPTANHVVVNNKAAQTVNPLTHSATPESDNDKMLSTEVAKNPAVTTKKAVPKDDVIEDWINKNLAANKDKKVTNSTVEPNTDQIAALIAATTAVTLPNYPLTQQANSNPFKVLENDNLIPAPTKSKKDNKNKQAIKSNAKTKSKSNAKKAQKPSKPSIKKKDK